jgi:hypothetical protein
MGIPPFAPSIFVSELSHWLTGYVIGVFPSSQLGFTYSALAGMYFCFLLCSKFLIYQEKLVLPLAMHIQ